MKQLLLKIALVGTIPAALVAARLIDLIPVSYSVKVLIAIAAGNVFLFGVVIPLASALHRNASGAASPSFHQ